MKKNLILPSFFVLFMTFFLSSCGSENVEPYDHTIRLSTYEITFQRTSASHSVSLESDGYITSAYSPESWLSVKRERSYITISATLNYSANPRTGTVVVTNNYQKSAIINITQLGTNTSSGGNDNPGGGNGGTTQQKPSAPTGVTVSNEGNNYIPDVRVRWNSVSDATSYYIYKSSSANGSYSKIGETSYAQYGFSDSNAPVNGASAYYKVKTVNSAGESAYSDYAKYTATSNDEAFAPAYTYGECTVSGSTITLRWTNSSGYGYGKATESILRVWNPYAEEWQDTKLSATATSASFNYSTKIDNYGYVKAGIIVSNAKGSYTAGVKVYDTKGKKWLN